MIKHDFEISFKNVDCIRRTATQFPLVARRALRRVANMTKTQASREIRAAYNIKKRDVDRTFSVRISPDADAAIIRSSGTRLPLVIFDAKQAASGVRIQVEKGKRTLIRSSFLAVMKSGHQGVFSRVAKKRLPIRELVTISVSEMFGARGVIDS